MKKITSFLFLFLLIIAVPAAFCFEVGVDIKGPQDLMALKDGISKTITARCLAKNISTGKGTVLNVSIIQLGDTISFDAILGAEPPRAFHRDLKSTGELSTVIDQMIGEIFAASPQKPAAGKEPLVQAGTGTAQPEYKFPFVATSMAVLSDTLFVSSEDTLFRVENGKAKPYWTPPKSARIYRLYTYQGTLLAVTNRGNAFFTYMIKDGKTLKSWDRCVVPLKGSLVASRIYSDSDLSNGVNRWAKTETVMGEPLKIPDGIDILSAVIGDISPAADGDEIVCFDKSTYLTAVSGKNTVCTSETKFGTLSLYIQDKVEVFHYRTDDNSAQPEPPVRYYIRPRIVSHGKDIITFINEEGLTRFIGNLKVYDSSRILACTPDESDFDERDLSAIKNSYCADIALDKGSVLALIVKKSTSLIQRIDL
jgi:hypothetical protein